MTTLLANNIKIDQSNSILFPEKKPRKFFFLFVREVPPLPENVELLKRYVEDRSVWSPKIHHLFPHKFKQNILIFVLSQKEYFKKKSHIRLPKPLVILIIYLVSVTNDELFFKDDDKQKKDTNLFLNFQDLIYDDF